MTWHLREIEPSAPIDPYAHVMWDLRRDDVTGFLTIDQECGCRPRCHGGRSLPTSWGDGGSNLRHHALPLMLPPEVLPDRTAPPEPFADEPPERGAVFVGVIDNATGFAHERFRRREGHRWRSRVDLLWLQGGEADGRSDFGRTLFRTEIDDLLEEHSRDGLVDEDALYRCREVGLIDMRRTETQTAAFAASHGTAVLDLVAGLDPWDERRLDAPDLPIVLVEVPTEVVRDTLGTFAAQFIAAGIWRMLDHVEAREAQAGDGRRYPIVINISFGLTAGSRDGSGLLEAVMRDATARRTDKAPLRFVLPAGNHRLGRTRARLDLAPDREATITLRLPPDDRTPSFIEFWGPPHGMGAPRNFAIRLEGPSGLASDWLSLPECGRDVYYALRLTGTAEVRAYSEPTVRATVQDRGRQRVVLAFPPTLPDPPRHEDHAPPGDYRIVLRQSGVQDTMTLDVQVQRDDTIPGFRRRGRQSTLIDPAHRRRDASGRLYRDDQQNISAIRRTDTLNRLADGTTPIVVGGAHAKQCRDAVYSGLGPKPRQAPPHVYAASERGNAVRGVLAAGTRSGGRTAVSGTSFAAPQVAREVAKALSADVTREHAWLDRAAEQPPAYAWEAPTWWDGHPLPQFIPPSCLAEGAQPSSPPPKRDEEE